MSDPILILGASGGIGSAIAARLAGDGHAVILHGRDAARLQSLAQSIGPHATWETGDLRSEADVEVLFSGIATRHTKLAAVIFSIASPFANRLTHRVAWPVFAEQMETQLKALHLAAAASLPLLTGRADTSRFIVVGTEFTMGSPPIKTAPYSAAKAAVTAYAQVLAQEWLKLGVRVHIVAPGLVKTALVADMPDEYLAQLAESMPEKELTRVQDVAEVVAFQLTDGADSLYGTPLRVSRGKRI